MQFHSRRIKHASLSSFCYGNLATKEEDHDQFVIHQTIFWTQRQQAHPLRGFGKLLIWSLSAEDMEFLSANPRCWPILLRISVLLRSVENWVLSSFNDKLLCLSFGLFKRPTAAYNNHGIVKAHRKVCGNNCDLLFPLASIYVGISIFRIDQKLS